MCVCARSTETAYYATYTAHYINTAAAKIKKKLSCQRAKKNNMTNSHLRSGRETRISVVYSISYTAESLQLHYISQTVNEMTENMIHRLKTLVKHTRHKPMTNIYWF